MTKKELTTLIRHVVREEVEYAVKKEINLLKEELKGSQPIVESIQPQSKNYTNNGKLNDLLNETALSFTSGDAQAFGAMRQAGQSSSFFK
jgi:hypothetical protein